MPRKVFSSPKPVEIDRPRTPLVLAAALVIGIGLTAGAIAWGRSDSGEINVAATINNSNTETAESGAQVQQAPTREHAALPNGGLVPADGSNPAPQPEPVVEETVPTTEEGDDTVASEEAEASPGETEAQ